MADKKKTYFETKDINLTAYLMTLSYKIVDVNREKGDGRTVFVFEDKTSRRVGDVLAFYNNKGKFLDYVNAWKDAKNLLHNFNSDLNGK